MSDKDIQTITDAQTEVSRSLSAIDDIDMTTIVGIEGNRCVIYNYEAFLARIKKAREVCERTHFVEEDRKIVKSQRAFVNKMTKAINSSVIELKRDMFDDADRQRAVLSDEASRLASQLSRSLDEFDARQRQEKYDNVKTSFEDMIFMMNQNLDDHIDLSILKLDDISDSMWFNRSTSDKIAREGMTTRTEMVASLMELFGATDGFTQIDARYAAHVLSDNGWSLMSARNQIKTQRNEVLEERRRIEREEELRQRAIEEAREQGRREAEQAAKEKAEADARAAAEAEALKNLDNDDEVTFTGNSDVDDEIVKHHCQIIVDIDVTDTSKVKSYAKMVRQMLSEIDDVDVVDIRAKRA